MEIDLARTRREALRWLILLTLNRARPEPVADDLPLGVARSIYPDATQLELRREIDYLTDRHLVECTHLPTGQWFCKLSRAGVDVAEYTVDCDPGIARPAKYWAG